VIRGNEKCKMKNEKCDGASATASRTSHSSFFIFHFAFSVVLRNRRRQRQGFSLLEVILALSILVAAMAALGQLVRFGLQNARRAEDMTHAAIAAESIMAEIVSGAREMTPELLSPYEDIVDENGETLFVYSVDVASSANYDGLLEVHVTVERDPSTAVDPVSCSLVRLMADPEYAASVAETTTGL
jgi:type II secretion system protein I